MKCNDAGRALIQKFEGLSLDAYLDGGGVPTIGYGHTGDVKLGMKITEHQADVIFDLDLHGTEEGVTALVPAETTDNQFAACCSLAFNIGLNRFRKSHVLAAMREGRTQDAAHNFLNWDHIGDAENAGLLRRRQAESALFLTP